MQNLYYISPSDEIFEEVKNKAMELWRVIDTDNDKYGYATEKINRIKDLENFSDNLMSIVAMFDILNQRNLANSLSGKAKQEIRNRLIDGGQPIGLIVF